MFKKLLNIAKIELSLKPESALLVKGVEAFDPVAPDMSFIRQTTNRGDIIFIPGSSIKGVIRSFSESILKGIQIDDVPPVCDISDPQTTCPGKAKDKKEGEKLPYDKHCLACRTFGSTDLASHVAFSDLMPVDPKKTMDTLTERPGVSIERQKGTVKKGGLFHMEILPQGTFRGTLTFTNYQLWQLGLILLALELMDKGIIKLGYAKSRGPGHVHTYINKLSILQFGPLHNENIYGIGMAKSDYKLIDPENDKIENISPSSSTSNGIWIEMNFQNQNLQSVIPALKNKFTEIAGG